MKLTSTQIAELVQGRLEGPSDVVVSGAAALSDATSTDVSFLKKGSDKLAQDSFRSSAAGVILVDEIAAVHGKAIVKVKDPMAAFSKVLSVLETERRPKGEGVHRTAMVSPKAKIGARASIGPGAVVEDDVEIGDDAQIGANAFIGARTKIGSDVKIYPNVVIREDTQIGNRCILQAGAVIGSDGYGYYFAEGRHNKIPQVGHVVIEDDVEIGSLSAVDRAMVGVTRIGKGTKIDNLVQVAHNVTVGQHSLLVAQVGIGGSSRIGNGVVLGGQVGVADHVAIGDGAQVGAQGGVTKDLEGHQVYWGTPAMPMQERLRVLALVRKLPELFKKIGQK